MSSFPLSPLLRLDKVSPPSPLLRLDKVSPKSLVYDEISDVQEWESVVLSPLLRNEKMSPKSQNRKASNVNQIGLSTGIFLWAQEYQSINQFIDQSINY